MSLSEPRRGDVWLARLDKTRPVVVLTRDPMGRHLHSVLVGPITSTVRGLSTEVAVGPGDGVRRSSVVNLDNAQLLDRGRLLRRVGTAQAATMGHICDALAIAVDCGR
jgi:mRNA interferase MazF